MSIALYDEAFLEKLNKWTKDTKVTVYGPEETGRMFRQIADDTSDAPLKLPIISLRRPGGFSVVTARKGPMSFDGATLDANYDKASQLNAIPVNIPYQLDVYTRYFKEADEYTRNLVFNLINYPRLDINIPYNNQNYIHHANIRLLGDIENNSEIPERLIPGQFTRMTIRLDIDDAYLFDVRYRDVYSIEIIPEMSDNSMEDDCKNITLI